MKRQFFLVVAVVLMVLPGCASTSSSYASRHKVVIDHKHVAAVEHNSKRKNIQVTWVNHATKRVAVEPESND